MTRIVLSRHGETVSHAENRYAGSSDVALTPHGLAQAELLAAWAAGSRITAIHSSTSSRARVTAEVSGAASGLTVQADPRLRELDFGRGEGMTAAEMRATFPAERAAFEADPVANPLPDGESPHAATDRFVDALNDIARTDPDGRVLIVAHSTVIRLALCHLIGVPLSRYRTLFPRLGNCTVTEIDLGISLSLLSFNVPPALASAHSSDRTGSP